MKLIIASESYPPHISGVAVQAQQVAYWAKLAGIKVFIITVSRDGSPGYFIQDEMPVFRCPSRINPWRPQARLAWVNTRSIQLVIAKFEPDLIHVHDPGLLGRAVVRSANRLKVPVVIHNHFSEQFLRSYLQSVKPFDNFAFYLIKKYLNYLYHKTNLVLTPSEFSKKEVESWGVSRRIQIVPNGIDIHRFKPGHKDFKVLKKYGVDPKLPYVMHLGRLDQDKNIQTLIEAIRIIQNDKVETTRRVVSETELRRSSGTSLPEIQFVFVGDGNVMGEIEEKAGKLGLKNVIFTGAIDRYLPDIPALYRSATIFWSASPVETQGIVTLEALASGAAVLAAAAGGTLELIDPGKNGELCPPFSADCFAKEVKELINNPKKREKFIKAGRETAERNGKEIAKKSILEVYHRYSKK